MTLVVRNGIHTKAHNVRGKAWMYIFKINENSEMKLYSTKKLTLCRILYKAEGLGKYIAYMMN